MTTQPEHLRRMLHCVISLRVYTYLYELRFDLYYYADTIKCSTERELER